MLSLSNVIAGYGEKQVLNGVSLEVKAGSIVTLLGANGAGKSTTLKTIVGWLHASSGACALDGKTFKPSRPDLALKQGVALVAEQRELFPGMSVRDNLMLGGYLTGNRQKIDHDMQSMFEIFPRLKERDKQLARTLSGGEQQMLAIARALMSKPRLMLMDEPSLGLAPQLVDEMFRVIKNINETGVTILLVEQNVALALDVADYGYVMETGLITLEGSAGYLRHSDAIKNSYL